MIGWLTDELAADMLRVITILCSLVLVVIAAGMLGRDLADLEYQVAAGVNGIRRLQASINKRTHMNRILLGFVFILTSMISLTDLAPIWLVWVNRLSYLGLIMSFSASSVRDWYDEKKQMVYLVEEEKRAKRIATLRGDGLSERSSDTRGDFRSSQSGSIDAGDGSSLSPRRSGFGWEAGSLAGDSEPGETAGGSEVVSESVRGGSTESGEHGEAPDLRVRLGE